MNPSDLGSLPCSVLSGLFGDPLFATALETSGWILVEHAGPWGKNALRESDLDPELVSAIERRMDADGVRVQLISPPAGRRPESCYVAADGTRTGGSSSLVRLPFADVRHVLDLDFAAIADGSSPAGGEPVTEPLYLVCANQDSDPCCGARGEAVHAAVANAVGDRARRTAHVGGHKYAANMVVFPRAHYYGRLDPGSVQAVVAATEAGDVFLDKWRGRSTYTCAEQAAEHFLRRHLGAVALDAVRLRGPKPTAGAAPAEVHFALSGGEEVVVSVTSRAQQPPRMQSCTDRGPTVPIEWVLEAIRTAPDRVSA
jgi:hypothetical protein